MVTKQLLAFFQVLTFLGTSAAILAGAALIAGVAAIGEQRIARTIERSAKWFFGGLGLLRKLALVLAVLVLSYAIVLLATSWLSREWTLAPGAEKYFCEVDCHLAYAVIKAERFGSLGPPPHPLLARGYFYVVALRTRFDEKTISPHRGDAPLQPPPRVLSLVDDAGRRYEPSPAGQAALREMRGPSPSLVTPLRPGESYVTDLVFELPNSSRHARLLLESPSQPAWLAGILIGDEQSLFHKKVFLRLPS